MKRTRFAIIAAAAVLLALPSLAAKAPANKALNATSSVIARAATPKKARLRPSQDRIDQAVNRLIKQSDVFWHAGDYEAVGQMYYVITDLDPTYLEGWQNYGWLLWSGLQRDDAAMRVFLRGLAYHPDEWELYFEIGYLEQHLGHYASAAQWYAKATGHNAPRHVWHARAHALEYAGLVGKSKAMWKTIIAKFPDNPVAPQNLKRLEEGRIRKGPALGAHQDPAGLEKRTPDTVIEEPVDPDSI